MRCQLTTKRNLYMSQQLLCLFLFITNSTCTLEPLTNVDFTTRVATGGLAVTDIDQDGTFEVIVAVSDGPNMIIQYSYKKNTYRDVGGRRTDFSMIRDPTGQTLSVCACDMDGDGNEEIFLLNKQSMSDISTNAQPHRLIKYQNGTFVDLLSYPDNSDLANAYSGGFVSCIDHNGDGTYGLLLGSYRDDGSGLYKLFALDASENVSYPKFKDVSRSIGLELIRDGTSTVIGPIVNDNGYSDIFVTNSNEYYINSNFFRHNNTNVLFRNRGNGRFIDVTANFLQQNDADISYSAVILDVNQDEAIDMLTCSLFGPSTKYIRRPNGKMFQTGTQDDFTTPSGCMNMLVADFDNNGYPDVFKDSRLNDNRNNNGIFEITPIRNDSDVTIETRNIGRHLQNVIVQGLTIADLNGDGFLELVVAHKPREGTTLSIYQEGNQVDNKWLRILPLTKEGAPARGSKVTLTLSNYKTLTSICGGGCSRMCQTEPLVHFGLGNMTSRAIAVTWPDGHKIRKFLYDEDIRKTLQISYTGQVSEYRQNVVDSDNTSKASLVSQHILIIVILVHTVLYYTFIRAMSSFSTMFCTGL